MIVLKKEQGMGHSKFSTRSTKHSLQPNWDSERQLTKNILCASGPDDDLGSHWRNPNFNTRVSIFGKLSSQNLIKLSEEYSVGDELQNIKKKKMTHNFV